MGILDYENNHFCCLRSALRNTAHVQVAAITVFPITFHSNLHIEGSTCAVMVSNILNDMIVYTISTLKKLLQHRLFQNNNHIATVCTYVVRCCIWCLCTNS
jgi:hypothetical protein